MAVDFDASLFAEAARDLGARFGLDYWLERDGTHEFPEELWCVLSDENWLGTMIPDRHGGSGLGMREVIELVEAVSAGGAGSTVGQLFMAAMLPAATIMRHGTEEQQALLLPRLASGEDFYGIALTEPDAGSNAFATATRATPTEGGYRLVGQKIFITALERTAAVQVLARTGASGDGRARASGLTLFILDPTSPGVEHAPMEKLGTHTMSTSMLYLDDVFVPSGNVIGPVGDGWKVIVDALNVERLITAAAAIGAGELALTLASEYASQRVVFDRPIGANQSIAFPLAHAKALLACSRTLLERAAELYDNGQPCAAEGNMAKLIATEAGFDACDHAMQVYGGAGYMREQHVERLWRDARLWKIAPISQEMALAYIAQSVLKLPRSY